MWLVHVLLALLAACLVGAEPYKSPFGANKISGNINNRMLGVTANTTGTGIFPQLLDHSDPSKGTFSQHYWYDTRNWDGNGNPPIVYINSGEEAVGSWWLERIGDSDSLLPAKFAKAINGVVVLLEHRYWGQSSPFDSLTTENLQYLTLDNSLQDQIYFAHNLDAPFNPNGSTDPADVPWVMVGGSYSAALAGWTAAMYPGTFWAYAASSGVVQAMPNNWGYFDTISKAAPLNCSTDFRKMIEHVDRVLLTGDSEEKTTLKKLFMLEGLEDVEFALALNVGPALWEGVQFNGSIGTNDEFYQFCDYVENVFDSNSTVPGAGGVGAMNALNGYSKWFTENYLPGGCASYGYEEWNSTYNIDCYRSLNSSTLYYYDLTVDNPVNRQWSWMYCNEGTMWWKTGTAPDNRTTMTSRLNTYDFWRQKCDLFFPPDSYGLGKDKNASSTNALTGGWSVTNTTRLLYVNGELDVWRAPTVSSEQRPGGPLQSTEQLPVFLIEGGTHCSDLLGDNWRVNPALQAIVDEETAIITKWVGEFYEQKKKKVSLV